MLTLSASLQPKFKLVVTSKPESHRSSYYIVEGDNVELHMLTNTHRPTVKQGNVRSSRWIFGDAVPWTRHGLEKKDTTGSY